MRRRAFLALAGTTLAGCTAPAAPSPGTTDADGAGSDSADDGVEGGGTTTGTATAAADATWDGGHWPMAGHDLANTGYNPDSAGPTERPDWRRQRVKGQWTLPGPSVVGDAVYLGSRPYVYALGPDAGLRWRYRTDTYLHHYPVAVADGRAYLVSKDSLGRASPGRGTLYAVDTESGEPAWTTGVRASSAPVPRGDRVYFAEMTDEAAFVSAVSTADGSGEWRHRVAGVEAFTTPALRDGRVFLTTTRSGGGGTQGTLHALDTADGSERWTASVGERVGTAPVLADDVALFGTDAGTVYGVGLDSGSVAWDASLGGSVPRRPVVAGSTAYVPVLHAGRGATDIVALDVTDGSVEWRTELDTVLLHLAATDRGVYATGDSLVGLARADGGEWFRMTITGLGGGGGGFGPVTVAGGRLFVGACIKTPKSNRTYHNYVYALGPPR